MKVGDTAPDFNLEAHDGTFVKLSQFRGKSHVVVFFYPKDDTPGWTKEACEFRNMHKEFQAHDAAVFGVSSDSRSSHQFFAQKNALPYLLLVDKKRRLRKSWKVPKTFAILDGRVTYVIDKQGICRFVFKSSTAPKAHVKQALSFIQKKL